MSIEKRPVSFALLIIVLFALGFSLTVNLPALQKNFLFADEAVYYMMTRSIARDADLRYTRRDLIDYYQAFDAGPLGIFLKKGRDDKIFFAKSFAYPLFAAPFVRIFGPNGFFVFHALLLGCLLLMGALFLERANAPPLALLGVLTFVFASAAGVYFLWISPDFFNLTLVFGALFMWLYKHIPTSGENRDAGAGRLRAFLISDTSDILACMLAGIAIFSKPPNIVLLGPLVLDALLRRRWLKAGGMILTATLTAGLFFGANLAITGDWNYQGGERKTFYGEGGYPLEKPHLSFEAARGLTMSSEGYAGKHLYPPRVFARNLVYYVFGRFSGIAWYFFPALLALILFAARRKQPWQWMLLAALAGEILIYCVLMPDNFAGGGGALANRYFLNIYPFFFFLPGARQNFKRIGLIWVWAAVFIAPILISPLQHSHYPATHAKRAPFSWMPVELTLVNNFPTNTNPEARRQTVGEKYTWLYFLDDNFLPRTESPMEREGFWTRGPRRAESVIKTYYPISRITFRLLNNPRRRNRITVRFAGESKSVTLGEKQWGSVSFTPRRVFRMNQWIHLYTLSVQAEKGSIPHFESEDSDEKRFLGVYFEVDIIPEYMPE